MSAGEVGLVWCAMESETTRTEVRCLMHDGENEVASFSGHLAVGVRGGFWLGGGDHDGGLVRYRVDAVGYIGRNIPGLDIGWVG